MRKVAVAVGLWLIVSLIAASMAIASGPGAGPRIYEGKTSQDKRLAMGLKKRSDGSLLLKGMLFRTLVLTCSIDASTQRWGIQYGFGRGLRLDGRTLDFHDHDPFAALTVQAKVKATTVDGTLLRFTVAALTEDEQPQVCTTGDLTFSAQRTVPAPPMRSVTGSSERGPTLVRHIDVGGRLTLVRLA